MCEACHNAGGLVPKRGLPTEPCLVVGSKSPARTGGPFRASWGLRPSVSHGTLVEPE